jgi:hypothetical protein
MIPLGTIAAADVGNIFSTMGANVTIALAAGTFVAQLFQARLDALGKVSFSAEAAGDHVQVTNQAVRCKIKDVFVSNGRFSEPSRRDFTKVEKDVWNAQKFLDEGDTLCVPMDAVPNMNDKDPMIPSHVAISFKVLGKTHFRKVAVSSKQVAQ